MGESVVHGGGANGASAALLALFPVEHVGFGGRTKHGRKRGTHGRGRARATGRHHHARGKLDSPLAKRDVWKHVGQAAKQG